MHLGSSTGIFVQLGDHLLACLGFCIWNFLSGSVKSHDQHHLPTRLIGCKFLRFTAVSCGRLAAQDLGFNLRKRLSGTLERELLHDTRRRCGDGPPLASKTSPAKPLAPARPCSESLHARCLAKVSCFSQTRLQGVTGLRHEVDVLKT